MPRDTGGRGLADQAVVDTKEGQQLVLLKRKHLNFTKSLRTEIVVIKLMGQYKGFQYTFDWRLIN